MSFILSSVPHMTGFVHFIVTRFNLKIWSGVQLDTSWYDHRIMLFESFCLPSIENQTNRSFHWLILCDSTTPPIYLERIKPGREFRSIAGCLPHSTIPARFHSITDLVTPPMWLQVIHGRNLEITSTWGRKRIARENLSNHFSLSYDLSAETENQLALVVQNWRANLEREIIRRLSPEQITRCRYWLHRHRQWKRSR